MWNHIVDLLGTKVWWRLADDPDSGFSLAYSTFNLAEAAAWFACAVFVACRYLRNRQGQPIEVAYALAFLAFAASDVVEARILASWLIGWKFLTLVALFLLRRRVMQTIYPEARLV